MSPEEAWRLITTTPSDEAVLQSLEELLDLGMRLAWEADTEWKATGTVSVRTSCAMKAANDEVVRLLMRAKLRGISVEFLESRVEQFKLALNTVIDQRSPRHDNENI